MAATFLIFLAVIAFVAARRFVPLLSHLKISELPAALFILLCGRAYRQQLHSILVHRHMALLAPPRPAKPAKRVVLGKRPMPPSAPARKPGNLPQPFSYPISTKKDADRAARPVPAPGSAAGPVILSDDWQAVNVMRGQSSDLIGSARMEKERRPAPGPVIGLTGHTATVKDARPGEWHEGEGYR